MGDDLLDAADVIRRAGNDPELAKCRSELARFAAHVFEVVGHELLLLGHFVGPDRKRGLSGTEHGTDETVAVSLLLKIGAQLISASTDLFSDGRTYAAAALARQLVEVEYLAWAFEMRDDDAERWLRSTKADRESFFRPAKLRKAAEGKFRGVDYSYHCELGGHPVPGAATLLLDGGDGFPQLLLADVLGHVGRTWDHIVGWARCRDQGRPVLRRSEQMSLRFGTWKARDPLVDLPPPPDKASE